MVAGTKGSDSFRAEIARRVAKQDPSIAMHWDRLADKHGVPDLVGNMPADVALFVEDPAKLAEFKAEIGRRIEAKEPLPHIAAIWDHLARQYDVPRFVGNMPGDLAAFAASPPEADAGKPGTAKGVAKPQLVSPPVIGQPWPKAAAQQPAARPIPPADKPQAGQSWPT